VTLPVAATAGPRGTDQEAMPPPHPWDSMVRLLDGVGHQVQATQGPRQAGEEVLVTAGLVGLPDLTMVMVGHQVAEVLLDVGHQGLGEVLQLTTRPTLGNLGDPGDQPVGGNLLVSVNLLVIATGTGDASYCAALLCAGPKY
jgi:hypothetical protein